MATQKLLITADSWDRILEEISREMEKVLDLIPENNAHANSLTLYLNTIKKTTELHFSYLPKAEREDIHAYCGAWMAIGILYGRSPEVLLDILQRTGAEGLYDEEEGGDKT